MLGATPPRGVRMLRWAGGGAIAAAVAVVALVVDASGRRKRRRCRVAGSRELRQSRQSLSPQR